MSELREVLGQILDELRAVRLAVESKSVPSVLLTREQLASLLQIDQRTLRRLELAGEVPSAFSLGNSKRWRRIEIDEWLSTRGAS